jgi:hypothetical protein
MLHSLAAIGKQGPADFGLNTFLFKVFCGFSIGIWNVLSFFGGVASNV